MIETPEGQTPPRQKAAPVFYGHGQKGSEMAKKYSCKNCGAELYFDPARGKLHCEYCGSEYDPSEYSFTPEEAESEDQTIAQSVDENGNTDASTDAPATDESVSTDDLVVYKCPNCGAEVITSKKTVATTCVYCNRAITLVGNVQGVFRPDYVLPFTKDRKEVEKVYRSLCKQSILTPSRLSSESTIKKIKGMYVPYWLFSFDGKASATVRAQKIRTYIAGKDEVTEVSSYDVFEEGTGTFERVPTDAMKAMDNMMMDSIEPFDFTKLEQFNPAYLTGFYTQQWDENSAATEPRAKARAKAAMSMEIMNHIGSYTKTMIEHEEYSWKDQKIELVMLPVWMMYMEYKGERYVFGMNGQTGKMMGALPKDPMKLVRIGAFIFVIVEVLLMIIRILGVM